MRALEAGERLAIESLVPLSESFVVSRPRDSVSRGIFRRLPLLYLTSFSLFSISFRLKMYNILCSAAKRVPLHLNTIKIPFIKKKASGARLRYQFSFDIVQRFRFSALRFKLSGSDGDINNVPDFTLLPARILKNLLSGQFNIHIAGTRSSL